MCRRLNVASETVNEFYQKNLQDQILFLPQSWLSPNILHSGFEGENESDPILIITNGLNKKILKYFKEIMQKSGSYFISGPIGIGKSFTLAYAILEARNTLQPTLIFYWNNPIYFGLCSIIREYFSTLLFSGLTDDELEAIYSKLVKLFELTSVSLNWEDIWADVERKVEDLKEAWKS